jgi:putative tricarboxylic transport membrane protein
MTMTSKAMLGVGVVLISAMVLPAQGQKWSPGKHVELVVPATAGGSLDFSARAVERIWGALKLVQSSSVVNKSGGGHAVAYSYLAQRTGDPHVVSITSPTLVTGQITGRLPAGHHELTPLATLTTEYIAFAVKAGSPIKTGAQLTEMLKEKPDSVTVALGNALGSTTHIALGLPLQSAGVDVSKVKLVAFNSSSEALTALMGGHVDVVVASTVSVGRQAQQGAVTPIAVSSAKRLGGVYANVPTWVELGRRGVFENWRGMIGAKQLTPAQTAYWGNVFKQVAESEEFREDAAKSQLEIRYRSPEEMRKFLDEQHAELSKVMRYLKIVKE